MTGSKNSINKADKSRGRPLEARLPVAELKNIKNEIKAIYNSLASFYKEAFNEASDSKYKALGFNQPADVKTVKDAFAHFFSGARSLPPLYQKVIAQLLGIPNTTPSTSPKLENEPLPSPSVLVQILDEKLLSDYLTGMGFAEWMGSNDAWKKSIRNGKDWLTANPEDYYCRGMLLWSVLSNGNPIEMVEILNETAGWLTSDLPGKSKSSPQFDSRSWRQGFDKKINQLKDKTVEHPGFVRWHLEDTLVRAALLRCLRFQGKSLRLEKEFTSLGYDLEKQHVMKPLFALTKSLQGDAWVAAAVEHTSRWAAYDRESGLARLCLLWFTGRQRQLEKIQFAIDQSCHWLERNSNHTFVRWATIWLAGRAPDGDPVDRLIDDSAKWLDAGAADDERLVRMGFLWLVSAKGNQTQVQQAIKQTANWLKAHPKDDFIRIAYLLFLIRRKGSPDKRRKVIGETRKWLQSHADVNGLTDLALHLCESASE